MAFHDINLPHVRKDWDPIRRGREHVELRDPAQRSYGIGVLFLPEETP